MKSNLRKALALLLTLIMVMTSLPTSALAEMVTDLAKSVTDVSEGKQLFGDAFVSPLSIVDDDTNNYTTYTFRNEKDEEVDKQIVKNGDTLYEPASPEKKGHKFVGWYEEGASDPFTGFGEQSEITETTEVTLTARFTEVHYVFFHDDNGRVVKTKEGVKDDPIDFTDVTFPVAANKSITGWYLDEDCTGKPETGCTLGTENVHVYAKVEEGFWVTYDSDGGTYFAPEFYAAGDTADLTSNIPEKAGYTFDDWYDGDTKVTTATTNVTVKAHWTARTDTKYTVIYWLENANYENNYLDAEYRDQTQYAYEEYKTLTGTTGELTDALADNSYDGFEPQAITQVTIAGDGSTIVNVYYNRIEYSVKFYDASQYGCGKEEHTHTRYGWNSCYDWNGNLTCGKEEHTHSSDCYKIYDEYTITAKYGANIRSAWPGDAWKVSPNGSTYQVGIDIMPLGGASFYKRSAGGGTETAFYYVEVLPGETGTEHNGVNYKLHHSDTSSGTGYHVTDEDKYPITGFTYKELEATGGRNGYNYNNAKFYYTRNSYDIVFVNNGEEDSKKSKKFEENITIQDNYTPGHPAQGVPKEYVFAGWYDNPLCEGEAYKFDGKMPSNNITLYAKWAPPTVSGVAFTVMDGGDDNKEVLTVKYGGTIDETKLPTPTKPDGEGWTFVCWATKDEKGNFIPFNFNTKIYANIELYPYFINTKVLTVTYDVNGGTSDVGVVDSKTYAMNAHADVLYATDVTAPQGEVFLGWNTQADGTGTLYQPGDKVKMTANVTLYAIWGDQAATTSITYHANNGTDAMVEQKNLANNSEHTVIGKPDSFTKAGYTFKGWAESSDATDATYQPGVKVRLDGAANNLYAVWEVINGTLTVKKVVNLYGDDNWKNTNFSNEVFSFTLTGDGVSETFDLKHGESKSFTVPYGAYTITETPKAGWTAAPSASQLVTLDAPAKTVTFTNTPTKDSVEVTVNKVWQDEDDTSVRPDSLRLIYRGTVTVDGVTTTVYDYPVTLTAKGNWELKINAGTLPTKYNGKTISYELVEDEKAVPSGYTQKEDDNPKTVTNVRSGNVEDGVVFYKVWEDSNNAAGYRPEINGDAFKAALTLSRSVKDGKPETVSNTPVITAVDGEQNKWKISYGELLEYDNQGKKYTYTLTEDASKVTNYTVDGNSSVSINGTITNKLNVGTLKITKQVTGVDTTTDVFTIVVTNKASKESSTITLKSGESQTLTLPIGEYTVAETIKGADGGTPEYWYSKTGEDDYAVKAGEETSVTITNTVEMTAVFGKKTWNDDNDSQNKRPNRITINLLRGDAQIDSMTVTADDGWKWSFDNLPAKNPANGNDYVYTITEGDVTDYTGVVKGTNVTNTLTGEYGVGAVSFTKVWDDQGDKFGLRPDTTSTEVTFELQRSIDGKSWNTVETSLKIAQDENADTWTISNDAELPIYNKSGVKYQYRIVETCSNKAYTVVKNTAVFGTNDELQNKLETASLTVEKVWFGAASNSVTVTVSATGLENQTIELTKADEVEGSNKWQQTITLPKQNAAGNAYKYKVEETVIDGYTTYYAVNNGTASADAPEITLTQDTTTVTITNTRTSGLTLAKTGNIGDVTFDASISVKGGSKNTTGKIGRNESLTVPTAESGKTYVFSETQKTGWYLKSATATRNGKPIDVVRDGTSVEVRTQAGDTIVVTFENQPQTGSFTVNKTDADGKPVADAEFTLYDGTGKKVAGATTNDDGVATFSGIAIGSYTLKETKAPTGYVASNAQYTVDVTGNEMNLKDATVTIKGEDGNAIESLTVMNAYDVHSFTLKKVVDDDTWAWAANADAEFGFTVKFENTTHTIFAVNYNGKKTDAENGVVTISGVKLKNNGSATFDGLPYGTTVTVTENANANTWTTTWSKATAGETSDKTASATVEGATVTVTATNRRVTTDEKDRKIKLVKNWDDEGYEAYRPKTITIEVFAKSGNGEYKPTGLTQQLDVTSDPQTYEISSVGNKRLAMYDLAGNEYQYELREIKIGEKVIVEGKTQGYTYTQDSCDGTKTEITNAIATKNVEVTKEWVDAFENTQNFFELRPGVEAFAQKVSLYRSTDSQKWTLHSDTTATKTVTKNQDGIHYTIKFAGLPQYDAEGNEIDYRVVESPVEHYNTVLPTDATNVGSGLMGVANGATIINTLATGSLTIEKVVVDPTEANEGDTASFTFTVKSEKDKVITRTLTFDLTKTGENDRKQSVPINGLPYGTYTVTEETNNAWTTKVGSTETNTAEVTVSKETEAKVTFTNTRNLYNNDGEIKVTKNWVRIGTEAYPDVTFELWQQLGEAKVLYQKLTLTSDENDTVSDEFTQVPAFAPDGTAYVYSVTEDLVPGYDQTSHSSNPEKTEWTFTNKRLKAGDIQITKKWEDDSDKFGLRPEANDQFNSYVTLARSTDGKNWSLFDWDKSVKDNHDNTYSVVFSGMPQTDDSGKTYQYRAVEYMTPDKYYVASGADYMKIGNAGQAMYAYAENLGTLTNTLQTGTITIAKQVEGYVGDAFEDGADEAELTFRFNIRRDMNDNVDISSAANPTITVKLTKNPDGTVNAASEPAEIVLPTGMYEVSEINNGAWAVSVRHDDPQVEPTVVPTDGSQTSNSSATLHTGYTVTFTNARRMLNDDGEYTVTKYWNRYDENEAFPNVTVTLSDGTRTRSVELKSEDVEVDGQNANLGSVSHTFDSLPANDLDGNPLTYTAEESDVNGYTAQPPLSTDTSTTFTNTADAFALTVYKKWVDGDGNAYTGELPASVTVKLWRRIAGGEETLYKTATLDGQNVDESGRWYDAASFGGPTHDAEGRPYEYFVTEDTVEGFTPEKSRLTMADFAKETDATNLYSAELVNRKVEDGEKQPEKTVAADFRTVQITDETTGKMVKDGDELTYTIGYYNHLSVPATIVVTDALNENLAFDPADNPGAEYDADTHTVTWTIEGVNPCSGGSVELKVKVMLTDDALASEDPTISNTAGVQIGNRPVQTAASEDVTVYHPRLKVEKITANVPAKGYYALGETAKFEITASNTGNVLLENIVITEQLKGAQFVQSGDYTVEDGKAIIAALNPGQSVVVRAQYTVKLDDLYAEDDQQQAPMKNSVTATAQSGDDPVDGGDESEFKPDQLTHLTVEKHWVDDLAVQRGDVRVQLTADGESYTADSRYDHEVIISSEDNLSPADENVWVMEFDRLPKHNADGSEIRYSAVETHVDGHGTVTDGRCDGYDVTVADDPAAHTTVITNTAQRKKFTVRKVWRDGEGNLAESLIPDTELTVALFVDGFDMNDNAFRTTLTRANGWEGKIDRMFAYNQAGVAYEYTPMEMDANGNAIADGGSIVIDGVTYDVSITTQTEPDANRAEAHRDVTVIVTNTRRSDDPEENKPTKEANLAPGKTTVSVGDSLTYTISYHNSRNVKADVTITDVLAESLNFGSASHGGTYNPATRTVTWVLRDVAAFASDAVTLTVTVNEKAKQADDAATVKNTATVVIPGNKADTTNTVEIPVEPEEGVKPTKKAVGIDPAKDTVEIGQKVEYRIGYRNHKNTAVSVRIVDKLDDGVKFISASDGGVYDAAKHTVFWNIAKLAPFADGEVTLTVEVTEAARKLADGETMATVNNTATVKFDNDPETETNVVDIPVKPNDPKKPEKKAEGLNATDTKKVGDEIVYTITYVNNLNKKAKVVVTDALDEGVDFVEADNGGVYDKASHTVTWTFDGVDPFEGDAVKLTVKVNEKARQIKEGETTATVDNTAAVTVDNKTTTTSDPVEIPVTPDKPTDPTKKADDKALNSFGKIAVGDQLPFTVSYVNNLNTVATVTVRDTLEEGLTFVSADNGGTYDEATRTVTWVLKDVAPFTSGSVTVITEVNENAVDAADPTVANSAVVKIGDQPEQTTEPAEVTVYNPAFSVEKKLTNLPAKGYFTAGETAAFDITVKNTGNVPLENVAVEELLDGVTFVQGEGYTIDGRIATIAALPIGEQIVLKAEYTVIEADLGNTDLANRITVRGETPENPDDPDQPHNPEDKGDEEPIPVDECVEITGTKTWNDADNAYGARPDVILVMLLANGEEKIGTRASAETEWKYTFIQQPKHDADGNEVVYSIREEEVPGYDTTYSAEGYDITNTLRRHTLTIRYWVDEVGGEQAFKTFTRDYYYGERYNVVSPAMDGYRADHEVVSGRIEGDLEVDVVYTAILWRLNIRYRRVGDGKTLAPMYTNGNVIIGDAYEVESPVIPGYTADRPVVKGEMHGRNMSFTVWYTPEQTEVVIVDEKTPFGLGNVVMNAGDCFE